MDFTRITRWAILSALSILALGITVQAQELEVKPPQSRQDLLLPPELGFLPLSGSVGDGRPASRMPRLPLFRMPTGFLSGPAGLDQDDGSSTVGEPDNSPFKDLGDPFMNRVQVNVGSDNPYFDFRRQGDPGGVGYFRLYSQFQILETNSTGLSLGCQAFSPAGLENDGLADGPTFFSPNVALFQDLGDGAALHGFVGTHMRAAGKLQDSLNRGFQYGSVQYGMAFQKPIVAEKADPTRGLFFFVEALGRYRTDNDVTPKFQISPWELLPGIHWRMSDSWWLSGAVVLPNGAPKPDNNFWQITCSFQF
jgi:hypothetical protein